MINRNIIIVEGFVWLPGRGLIVVVRVMVRMQLTLVGTVDVVADVSAVDASVLMWRVDLNKPIGTGPCAFRPLGCSVKRKGNEFSLNGNWQHECVWLNLPHSWQTYRCGVPSRAEQIEQYQQKSSHQHRIDGVRTATGRHGAI